MVNNYDWTASLSVLDFLRDVGKHFPVNRMLARDVVARRLESGISYTEFSYVLLQSMDYRELHRRHGVTLQTGGSDQWGNLTAGVELIRRSDQARVHAMATPLLTKADGTKFGKTESGTVWLDPTMTSPLRVPPVLPQRRGRQGHRLPEGVLLPLPGGDRGPGAGHARGPLQARGAARPRPTTSRTSRARRGRARQAAVAAAAALFGRGELAGLAPETLESVLREVGAAPVDGDLTIVDAMALAGIVESKGAARRAVAEGGAYLNNVKVDDPDLVLSPEVLVHGRFAVLRRGRKTVGGVYRG